MHTLFLLRYVSVFKVYWRSISKRKSGLAEKKLYTLLLREKVSRIQFVYEPKMRWGSLIHIVEEEKTLKVDSCTYCIRAENSTNQSVYNFFHITSQYIFCISHKEFSSEKFFARSMLRLKFNIDCRSLVLALRSNVSIFQVLVPRKIFKIQRTPSFKLL